MAEDRKKGHGKEKKEDRKKGHGKEKKEDKMKGLGKEKKSTTGFQATTTPAETKAFESEFTSVNTTFPSTSSISSGSTKIPSTSLGSTKIPSTFSSSSKIPTTFSGSSKSDKQNKTIVMMTTTVNPHTKDEIKQEKIAAIVFGISFFLLLSGIIIRYLWTCIKKKKRKTPKQKDGNNKGENLYEEINESKIAQEATAQETDLCMVNDTGEYSHLSSMQIFERKTGSVEMDFKMNSTGYCHIVRKSTPVLPKITDKDQVGKEEMNVYNVLENVTSDQGQADKEEMNIYNDLENVTSDQGQAGKEEMNVYNVPENVTSDESNVYSVLEKVNSE